MYCIFFRHASTEADVVIELKVEEHAKLVKSIEEVRDVCFRSRFGCSYFQLYAIMHVYLYLCCILQTKKDILRLKGETISLHQSMQQELSKLNKEGEKMAKLGNLYQ